MKDQNRKTDLVVRGRHDDPDIQDGCLDEMAHRTKSENGDSTDHCTDCESFDNTAQGVRFGSNSCLENDGEEKHWLLIGLVTMKSLRSDGKQTKLTHDQNTMAALASLHAHQHKRS